MSAELEIVGLHSATNGRSCCQHATCGYHVACGDILRLVKTVVTVNGITEEAIKLVKVADGTESCTVAFVPRLFASLPKTLDRVGKFCQVVELYDTSDNTHKRRLSKQNYGMASVVYLEDIPMSE
jgi:hypothetical protein